MGLLAGLLEVEELGCHRIIMRSHAVFGIDLNQQRLVFCAYALFYFEPEWTAPN